MPAPENVTLNVGPSVSVSWSKPAGISEVSYLLTLSSDGESLQTVSTQSLHYSFSDLLTWKEYSFSVSAVQRNGIQSKPVSKTIRTGEVLCYYVHRIMT